jgi:VWFA-related protein
VRTRLHILAMILLLVPAARLGGQAPPGPVPPRPGAKVQQPPQAEQRIRVKVELVTTPVTVRDARGELVLSLERRHFRVFDDGVEQRIEDFDLGGDPLSVVILFETSSRVEPMLPAVRKTGILFTQTVLGQTGEAAIFGYDDEINLLLPFTQDQDRIEKSVAQLRMGTSGARMQDALAQAVGMLRNRPADRRRVIIVVGEAADTGSETPLGAVVREAQLNNITIYSVGLSTTAAMLRGDPPRDPTPITPPGTYGRPGIPGSVQTPTTEMQRSGNINLMAAIVWMVQTLSNGVGENSLTLATAGTGGLHLPTFRDRSIETAIDQIGAELHAQYSLTYRPTGTLGSGFHEIRIEVNRPGFEVRARPGYYLAPPEEK